MNNIGKFLLLTALYFVTGKLGLLLAVPPGYATAVWPPSGFAFAGILIFGYRFWPAIWLGSFLVNIGTSLDLSTTSAIIHSILPPLIIALGAAIQAVVGAMLVRRFIGYPLELTKEFEVFKFVFLSSTLSCLIAATVGILTLVMTGAIKLDSALFSWWTWWVGDSIGVLIFAPLMLIFFGQPKEIWRSRIKTVGLPMLAAFVIVVFLFVFMKRYQEKQISNDFNSKAKLMSVAIENNIDRYLDVLNSIQSFYLGSQNVDRSEFSSFVKNLLERFPGIQALEWDPKVRGDERDTFEQTIKNQGFPDFEIKEMGSQGNIQKSSLRDVYFPITYAEPLDKNGKVLGFDFMSEKSRTDALKRAWESGNLALTKPIKLIQGPLGLVAFLSIYENNQSLITKEDRAAHLKGFVVEIIKVNDVINGALQNFPDNHLVIQIVDDDPLEGELEIFTGHLGRDQQVSVNLDKIKKEGHGLFWNKSIDLGGRHWKLQVYPTSDYFIVKQDWSMWFILAGWLLFIGLFGGFLLVITGREKLINNLVDERTKELKQTQQKALEAEERFRMIVEGVKDYAIFLLDVEGNVVTWNQGAERFKGYKAEEVIGQHFSKFYTKEDIERRHPWKELEIATKEGIYTEEGIRIRKDGKQFWAHVLITALKDHKGNLRGFSKITRDISIEKEIRDKIAYLSAYQKAIVDNAGYAIITGDLKGTITSFNPAAEKMLGYTAQEMVGKLTPAVFHDMDEVVNRAKQFSDELKEEVLPGYETFIIKARKNLPNTYEWIYVHKNGHRFPVLLSVTALRDSKGIIFGYLGLATNISELKDTQNKLLEITQRFDLAKSSAEIGVWEWNIITNTLIWDEKMYSLYGIRESDFSGAYEAWEKGVHPEDKEKAVQELQDGVSGKKSFDTEFRVIWPDKTIKYIKAFGLVTRDNKNKPLKMVGVNWDITSKKVDELNLKRITADLERSNKELEQFAYIASHDLQEPLRMVASFTQLLEKKYKDQLDDKAREYIHFAVDGAKRMQGLIDDLLMFSRAGAKNVVKAPVNLNLVCNNVIKDLSALLQENKATVELGPMPILISNETQMNQLFLNLIGNGIKYKSDRDPIIKVSSHQIDNKQWQFSVSDNGIGIDEQYFGKLFVIFQRLHTKKAYKGTGIGLALCKKIVENYGGRIWIESKIGEGTTFNFILKEGAINESS